MIPKFLYQYTDIESLEKIYKTKTILFKRLDLLNDPFEGVVRDDLGESMSTQDIIYIVVAGLPMSRKVLLCGGFIKDFVVLE